MPGKPRHDEAIALALARGKSAADAATEVGVNVRTVERRRAEPSVQQRIEEIRKELTAKLCGRFIAMGDKAADELEELLESEVPQVKLSAVRLALEHMSRSRAEELLAGHYAEIAERVRKLEMGTSPTGGKKP